jgi:hypothetical protein
MIDLGEAEPINQLIQDFRHYASDGYRAVHSLDMGGDDDEPEDLRQPSAEVIQLREAILEPLCPYLQKHQHLFIAPDGNLNLLPFQILPTDETGEQLLMDEYRISYLSVGRDILRSQVQTQRPASQPLVIADPDFNLEDLTPPNPPFPTREWGEEESYSPLKSRRGAGGEVKTGCTRNIRGRVLLPSPCRRRVGGEVKAGCTRDTSRRITANFGRFCF